MRRRRWMAVVLSLALAGLACQTLLGAATEPGGDTAAATSAPQVATERSTPAASEATATNEPASGQELQACSLLSAAQVEQVYGEDAGEPESIEHDYVALGDSPACFWNGVGARVTLLVPPAGYAPQAFYEETIRRMNPTETLTDLGDEAWTDASDGDLLVRAGEVYFLVEHVPIPRSAEAPELTRGLAEQILQNLP